MSNIFQAMALFLPIKIERASWDVNTLVLHSMSWSFRTESAWRVSKDDKLLFACWDEGVLELVSGFVNLFIIEAGWLIEDQPIDPFFKLSDGRVLNVFCSSSIEPWCIQVMQFMQAIHSLNWVWLKWSPGIEQHYFALTPRCDAQAEAAG